MNSPIRHADTGLKFSAQPACSAPSEAVTVELCAVIVAVRADRTCRGGGAGIRQPRCRSPERSLCAERATPRCRLACRRRRRQARIVLNDRPQPLRTFGEASSCRHPISSRPPIFATPCRGYRCAYLALVRSATVRRRAGVSWQTGMGCSPGRLREGRPDCLKDESSPRSGVARQGADAARVPPSLDRSQRVRMPSGG